MLCQSMRSVCLSEGRLIPGRDTLTGRSRINLRTSAAGRQFERDEPSASILANFQMSAHDGGFALAEIRGRKTDGGE